MAIDLLALKDELTNDPNGYGLPGMGDEAAAEALNLVRVAIQLDRESVPAGEIAQAIKLTEFEAVTVTAAQRQWLLMILGAVGTISVKDTEAKTGLLAIFGVGTTTRTNLVALSTRAASRAEQLGFGVVTPSDVADARRLI